MIWQRRDRDIADAIDSCKQRLVDAEHAVLIGEQLYLAFGNAAVVCAIHSCHLAQSARSILFVDLAGVFLPDKNMLLADIQKLWNILLGDHMTALKRRALKAIHHRSDVVA